jgi:hypothetical protein
MNHPIRDAHTLMVTRLATIIPPRIYINPDPEDFEAVSEYLMAVASVVDQCLLSVGQEVQSNASVRINLDLFTNTLRDEIEGNAVFEVLREAETIKEDRVA